MSARPCREGCGRPKEHGRHRCLTCRLRSEPVGVQVEAARARLAMVPEEHRLSRRAGQKVAPEGRGFCAGCQSFRDLDDFAKSATKCRACASAVAHAGMIARTYGLDGDGYDALLARQGGKCAICRARPKSKRLAVDHDHGSGAVRGLLCSRCNHDLMGAAWDSTALASALLRYLMTPPTSGVWIAPEDAAPIELAVPPVADSLGLVNAGGDEVALVEDGDRCTGHHYLPSGWEPHPEGGAYRVWYDADDPEARPF